MFQVFIPWASIHFSKVYFMINFEVCVCKIFYCAMGYHIINSFIFFLLSKGHILKTPRVKWNIFHINFDVFLFHSVYSKLKVKMVYLRKKICCLSICVYMYKIILESLRWLNTQYLSKLMITSNRTGMHIYNIQGYWSIKRFINRIILN